MASDSGRDSSLYLDYSTADYTWAASILYNLLIRSDRHNRQKKREKREFSVHSKWRKERITPSQQHRNQIATVGLMMLQKLRVFDQVVRCIFLLHCCSTKIRFRLYDLQVLESCRLYHALVLMLKSFCRARRLWVQWSTWSWSFFASQRGAVQASLLRRMALPMLCASTMSFPPSFRSQHTLPLSLASFTFLQQKRTNSSLLRKLEEF